MGRWFVPFFVGLTVVGIGIFGALYMNRGSHLDLTGSILKVRTIADGDGTIVFADFRVTNAAAIPFVVSSVKMTMDIPVDEATPAVVFSKSDVEKVTKYLKVLGPKYNDVLSIQDKLPPVETVDRMAAGRFPFPPKIFQQRKTLRLRIEEVDGAFSEITEKNSDKTAAK